MTEAAANESSEDRGLAFFVVRMELPSEFALQGLPVDVHKKVQENVRRARQLFRSRTLPLPGSDARLSVEVFPWDLSGEVEAVLLDGIDDKAAIATLTLPEPNNPKRFGKRVYATMKADAAEFDTLSAAELLDKYWYRHQEFDIFDAVTLARDLQAARERGESGANLFKPKAPLPPRR